MSKYEPSRPPRNIIVLLLLAMLALVGCGDGKSVRQLPHLGNTPYQQDTILMTYATNPERALTLLDSALLLGNISEYRGQVIRAKIYSKSLTEQRLDSAILICEALLEHDSVRNEPASRRISLTCSLQPAVPSPSMSNTFNGPHRRQNSVSSKARRPNAGAPRPTSVW